MLCPWVSIPTLPSKVGVKKWNYDAIKKFQDKWVAKFPWAWVGYLGKMEVCTLSNVEFVLK
jgi:hypothetical protein